MLSNLDIHEKPKLQTIDTKHDNATPSLDIQLLPLSSSMVDIETVCAINHDLVQRQSLVAVFAGGTGGIGALSVKALASAAGKSDGKGLRAYIIGRNASAADETIAECRRLCPTGQFHFIQVKDCALIRDVDAACKMLVEAEERNASLASERPRIDYLMLSQGGPIFLPRQGMIEAH